MSPSVGPVHSRSSTFPSYRRGRFPWSRLFAAHGGSPVAVRSQVVECPCPAGLAGFSGCPCSFGAICRARVVAFPQEQFLGKVMVFLQVPWSRQCVPSGGTAVAAHQQGCLHPCRGAELFSMAWQTIEILLSLYTWWSMPLLCRCEFQCRVLIASCGMKLAFGCWWGPVHRHRAMVSPARCGGDAGSLLSSVLPPELDA